MIILLYIDQFQSGVSLNQILQATKIKRPDLDIAIKGILFKSIIIINNNNGFYGVPDMEDCVLVNSKFIHKSKRVKCQLNTEKIHSEVINGI